MNRAQRRSGQNIPTETLYTATQVQYMLKVEGKRMWEKAVNDYSAVIAWCLLDKLGFKLKRCQRFLGQVSEMFEYVQTDEVSIEDIKKQLEEEVNIIIK